MVTRFLLSFSILILLAQALPGQNTNISLRSKLTFAGQSLANVWGYASEGREYALVGGSKGLIIVDITDPESPVQIVQIPGPNNQWKEIKTYGHYAYVVSEGGMGVQIVDLALLPSPSLPYKSYYGNGAINNQLNKGHALHIDTAKGYLYVYGSNLFGGAPVVINLEPDPWNPVYAGKFDQLGYVHDGFVDNDTMYSCHIYAGQIAIVDMSSKSAPHLLATQTTPGAFPHNTWLANDRRTLLTTDEVSNSFLTAYDISDPTDIRLLDKIQSNPGSNSIVHNTHILDHYAVTSWYRDGFTVVDITRPDILVQVGNYDTYAGAGSGFQGCWGVYPFFPSGTIIASNISAPGSNNNGELFILTPQYIPACYLEGTVRNAVTGAVLPNASVVLNGTSPLLQKTTDGFGAYKMGQRQDGLYYAQVSCTGYQSQTLPVLLEHGVVRVLDVDLYPNGSLSVSGQVLRLDTQQPVPGASVFLYGLELVYNTTSDGSGAFSFGGVAPGLYDIASSAPGYGMTMLYQQILVADTDSILLELMKGYRRGKPRDSDSAPLPGLIATPNPFHDQTLLHFDAEAVSRIELFDQNGRLVADYRADALDSGALLLGNQLTSGHYLVRLTDALGMVRTLRLVKSGR